MKIGINGSFARKGDAGMGQVTVNFLKTLAKVGDPKDDFYIYLEEDLNFKLPKNFHKKVLKSFYKRDDLIRKIYWENFLLPWMVKKDRCEKLFSLYQSTTVIRGIPHLMLIHDVIVKIVPGYINNFRKKVYYSLVDRAIKKVNKVMTISDHSKEDIIKIYNKNKKEIIVNYIDCDPIFKKKTKTKGVSEILKKYNLNSEKYLFYIGGFDIRKNVNALIRSYSVMWGKYQNKKNCPDLVLAGNFNRQLIPLISDVESEIDNVCSKFGVPRRRFKFLGFVEQSDLPTLYQNAEAFCFPSLYEGFGLPVLEAFNCGCPVITSQRTSLKEFANEKNSFIFKPEKKNLAEKMFDCLNEAEKQKVKVNQAKRDAEKFSWEKFTKKALDEIRGIKTD